MKVFEQESSNRKLAIASTYSAAAQQVNVQCGPEFVNASLPAAVTSSSGMRVQSGINTGLLALVMVGAWLF
jgi:hypothetical protein